MGWSNSWPDLVLCLPKSSRSIGANVMVGTGDYTGSTFFQACLLSMSSSALRRERVGARGARGEEEEEEAEQRQLSRQVSIFILYPS